MPKMDDKKSRLTAVTHITGVGQNRLVKWIDRGVLKLSLEGARDTGQHRRFGLYDVCKIALVARHAQYGMEVVVADKLVDVQLRGQKIVTYVGKRKNPLTGESVMNSLRGVVWTLWPEEDGEGGVTWHRIIGTKPAAEDDLESYVIVNVGKIIDATAARFKAHHDPEDEATVSAMERKYRKPNN